MHIVQIVIWAITFGVIGWRVLSKYIKFEEDGELTTGEVRNLVVQAAILLAIGFTLVGSFTYTQQGYGCITIDPIMGTISDPVVGEKFFFRKPWARPIYIYHATQSTEMWTDNDSGQRGEYPAVRVLSKDGLDIEVDILIRYELETSNLADLYRSYPDLKYESRAISSVTREDVRDVISSYTTLEVVELRETISVAMTNKILSSLEKEPSLKGALKNVQIDLRDIDPPISFKEAVQDKKKAEQQKLQAEHEREKLLIQADATAKESIRKAQGEAEATMIRANATKKALALIGQELDPDVYYSLQQLEKIAPNTKYLILTMGEDGVPIILNQAP